MFFVCKPFEIFGVLMPIMADSVRVTRVPLLLQFLFCAVVAAPMCWLVRPDQFGFRLFFCLVMGATILFFGVGALLATGVPNGRSLAGQTGQWLVLFWCTVVAVTLIVNYAPGIGHAAIYLPSLWLAAAVCTVGFATGAHYTYAGFGLSRASTKQVDYPVSVGRG